jgi:hypothetical protein
LLPRDATILELASTIHWLISVEHSREWRTELIRRKGIKAAAGRIEQATELLNEIGLPVTV